MTVDVGTLDLVAATLQADIDRLGWGTTAGAAGLQAEVHPVHRWVDLYLPVIREVFPEARWQATARRRNKVTALLAQAVPTPDGYAVGDIQTGKLPSLRPVLSKYLQELGVRTVDRAALPELLSRFDAALSAELVANGVEPTRSRVLALLAFRYARGLGETVNASYSPLPVGVYEYIAADVAPQLLLLNFSKGFNLLYAGNGRFVTPPIPLDDAKRLGNVPARLLRDLYLPKLEQLDFS